MVAQFFPPHARFMLSTYNIIIISCQMVMSPSSIIMLTRINSQVNMIMLHVDTNKSPVNITMLLVDKMYLTRTGRSKPPHATSAYTVVCKRMIAMVSKVFRMKKTNF